MPVERGLKRIQNWMLEVVTAPGGIEEALASPAAERLINVRQLGKVILPSATLTSAERLDIYHRMYGYRMVEAMQLDYPGVEHFLDHYDGFRQVVIDYVNAHPSRSYTLNRLGDAFPDYLKQRTDLRRHRFLHDLARFELAITLTFDEQESVSLTPDEIAAIPSEAWPVARLEMIKAFRLLELDYPVDLYVDSVKDSSQHPPLRKSKRWMMLYRRNYRVMQLPIDRRQWQVLRRLRDGLSLGEAIEEVSRKHRPVLTETELFTWFRKWTALGLFARVHLPYE